MYNTKCERFINMCECIDLMFCVAFLDLKIWIKTDRYPLGSKPLNIIIQWNLYSLNWNWTFMIGCLLDRNYAANENFMPKLSISHFIEMLSRLIPLGECTQALQYSARYDIFTLWFWFHANIDIKHIWKFSATL